MRPQSIHKFARVTGWASILIGLVLLAFVVSLAASAAEVNYLGTLPTSSRTVGGNELMIGAVSSVSNPGLYSLQGFRVNLHLLTSSGVLVAFGSSNTTTLPARTTSQVPLQISANLSSPAARQLITTNMTLIVNGWVNATYAALFPVHLFLYENYPWGAPFDQLNYTFGTPTPSGNTTENLPLTLGFRNWFPVPDYGTFTFSVMSPNGTSCGQGKLSMSLPVSEGSSYEGTTNLLVNDGCNYHGGTLDVHYSGLLLSLDLPVVTIP